MRLSLVIVMVCALVQSAAVAGIQRGPITNPANNHVYYELTPAKWTEAEAQAKALGGHLVTMSDDAENSWVFDRFSTVNNRKVNLWIGMNDARLNAIYEWVSGEIPTYTNFGRGEPNHNGLNDHYVLMSGTTFNVILPRQWNDVPDGEGNVYGVVEVVPEPSVVGAMLALGGIQISRRGNRRIVRSGRN